jgi:hypothetical protein
MHAPVPFIDAGALFFTDKNNRLCAVHGPRADDDNEVSDA